MPKISKTALAATETLGKIEQEILKETSSVFEVKHPNPYALRQAVRSLILQYKWYPRVVLSAQDDTLYVLVKSTTYIMKLEEMVRRLALSVDDDNLYDEALALVRFI